jgi:peptidoglycan/LPS O-acetylase OafA/YrhL
MVEKLILDIRSGPPLLEYRTLTHWRGIAALWVMIFHGFGAFRGTGSTVHPLAKWLYEISHFGWFGVHLFFVISGYCIAANVYRLSQNGEGAWAFLRDRLLRIYPLYWVVCINVTVLNLLASPFNGVPLHDNFPDNWVGAFANFLLFEPYLGTTPFLLVSWSLVYELGFYVLFFVGLYLFSRGIPLWSLIVVALGMAFVGLSMTSSGFAYVLNYWPEFLSGSVVFMALLLRPKSEILSSAVMVVPLVFVFVNYLFDGEGRTVQMTGVALFSLTLFYLKKWDETIAAFKLLRGLAWIGVISY